MHQESRYIIYFNFNKLQYSQGWKRIMHSSEPIYYSINSLINAFNTIVTYERYFNILCI